MGNYNEDDFADSLGGSAGDFEGTNFGGDTATSGGSLGGRDDDGGDDAQDVIDFPNLTDDEQDVIDFPNLTDDEQDVIDFPSLGSGVVAPNLINQPLAVGSKVAVMPYDSYQRSPQQMFGAGGLTASPYSPSQISFQGGAPAASFNPLGGDRITQFDMGRAPTPAGTPDDRNFLERTFDAIGGRSYANQRAGVFNPRTGTFQQFDGQTTLEKTSDNMVGDFLGNAVASALGLTPFTGRLDTKTYTPLAGGEDLQYSTSRGGLLSDRIGEQLVPMSEIQARQSQMGGGGDDGRSDQPLIVPEQTPEEEREQSAFPQFTPRQFEYQPFVSQFYTIPSRFTKPYGLLG
jgi:hypothetical protein